VDKILALSIGGAPATLRLSVRNMSKEATTYANRPAKLTIYNTFGHAYKENSIEG
ncbi:hypothetical protein EDB92DRAFT_1784080, partial [Lactarius akahatsu]